MTPADVLDAAAGYIEEHGWHQGDFEDGQGRVCAMGGMMGVAECGYMPALTAFSGYLDESVADWNDAEHRTAEQVVKELRACAQSIRDEQ